MPGKHPVILLLFVLAGIGAGKEVTIVGAGTNAPDTAYLSRNAAALQQVPLDGVATWIASPVPIRDETGALVTTRLASGRLCRLPTGEDGADIGQTIVPYSPGRWRPTHEIPPEHIAPAIADLDAVEFDRFSSNFIHCLLGNGGHAMNWFDDELWRIICHNIGAIARVAKQGGCRGILIDPQAYSYSMWSYPILTETSGRTFTYRRGNKAYYEGRPFAQVEAMVRQRGREFAGAVNAEFAGPIVMFFRAAGLAASQLGDPRWDSIGQTVFWLIMPFLDGMLEGSTEETIIVDCNNQGLWTERVGLERVRNLVLTKGLALSQVPALYRKKMRVGFCYRLGYHPQEYDIEGRGRSGTSTLYDPALPKTNFFSPARLEKTLKLALDIGDGYVLFYNTRACWWLDSIEARPAADAPMHKYNRWVPHDYWRALENARRSFD